MLASPLLVGALAAGLRPVHLLLGAFWFAGYFAFFAGSVWLKSGRRPRHLRPVQVYVALAAVLGAATLAASPGLLRWAPAFAVPLGIALWSSAPRNERALVSGLATTVGSAIMALVAYDAGGGTSWLRAWTLAAVQAAYFAGTVFYVKSLIRERGSATFLRASIGYHLAVVAVAAVALLTRAQPTSGTGLSWLVVAVLAVLAGRAAAVPRLTLAPSPKQIGLGEVGATVAVALSSLVA